MRIWKLRLTTILLIVFGVVRPSESSAKTEIGELYMAVSVDEYVVRLDVPGNDE